MIKLSKRMSIMYSAVDAGKQYDILEGISLLKELSTVHFIESLDVVICLGIDPKKSEQNIRGSIFLPHGTGRDVCVIVFTQGTNVILAKNAGADFVGLDDLVNYVTNRKNKFDVVLATPDVMNTVVQLGPVLGPRGLMPNPKFGTVSHDIAEAVRRSKIGQIRYKNDKYGTIHASIGMISFSSDKLKENLVALIMDVKKNKPIKSKGVFFKKIMVSSSMGVALSINQNSLFL
ncbi:50S ribosomal protein L1 [Blochmannia endosymbiont of Polyrhachis (Hedomyrma) turneri]|uniref:50S ribosomal protein L1 n=1 Tax=Blochmannia endosymbiont of Polyrhachis (Hedomyrma) turneri TaxID=1505596 RepID=UPI00061A89FC|nr:50S ribosomal protein L1 [Blochmannia endosymbiont of Polyrhachis (Hedomyrma) turneri]AKC60118.1 50S ribosomal protein L1 [Blochmannia endosymbiont of Polyrhachis (Hedomyrma) turneri]